MRSTVLLAGAILAGCATPGAGRSAEQETVSIEVRSVSDLDACRDQGWAPRVPRVCVLRNGEVLLLDSRDRPVARTSRLEEGCRTGNAFLVGGKAASVLFVRYGCLVRGGTLMVVARDNQVRVVEELPFNFLDPLVTSDGVFVVAAGMAGRLEWTSFAWRWRQRLDEPGGNGAGALQPESVAFEGGCLIIAESKLSAAQYRRPATELRLTVGDGRVVSREACSSAH